MSTPTFHVLPAPHPSTLPIEVLLSLCTWGRTRASGPGGQHRNKVETAIWIRHEATGIEAQASERRSAEENRKVAMGRLRLELALGVRCLVPLGEIRSALWKSRCSAAGIISCSPSHEDFPRLLAEALDVIHAASWDVKRASLRLCCSQSQLIKLIKDFPAAFVRLNQERMAGGLHILK